MKSSYLIGVAGGSGAGKTYFINQLVKSINPENLCLISQDNYYKKIDYVPVDANGIKNFDTLEAIDFDLLIFHIERLRQGEIISLKEYTFNNKFKKPQTILIRPAPIIIIEGLFVFAYSGLRNLFDLKIFIDSSEEDKLRRRIYRDEIERGYNKDDVTYRYENHVNPAFKKYIEPYKEMADHIIVNDGSMEDQIDKVSKELEKALENLL